MAITEVYVDPAINANSGTGTIGDPFGDLQYALNNTTRDATNGDRFNIKAGTAEVLSAELSLATYGTPSHTTPLVIQGYTSAAGDGGIGEINNGGANVSVFNSANNGNKTNVTFADMKMGNCGTARIINLASSSGLINCEIHTCSESNSIYGQTGRNLMLGCYVHSTTGSNSFRFDGASNYIVGNYIISTSGTQVFEGSLGSHTVLNNVIVIDTDTNLSGLHVGDNSLVMGNIVYSKSANVGFAVQSDNRPVLVINNVFIGFSGSGGKGLYTTAAGRTIAGGNAYYNNATNISEVATWSYSLADSLTLDADPFVNAAGGNFEIDGDSDASEAAWPHAFKGLGTTTNAADIGAVQSGAGAGGGGGPVIGSRVIRGLGAI